MGTLIDCQTLEELKGSGAALVDVRTPGEYESGYIVGTRNIPLDSIGHVPALVRDEQPLVLVCRSGNRAMQAAQELAGKVSNPVFVLMGGLNQWEQEDRPVAVIRKRWSMERQVRGAAGVLVMSLAAGSQRWKPLGWGAFAIGAGLTFAAVTDTCGMAAVLSKLPYNRATTCDLPDSKKEGGCNATPATV